MTSDLKVRLLSLRNSVDYIIRNNVRLKRPLKAESPIPGMDYRVQNEFKEFLELFPWDAVLPFLNKDKALHVADVGARNFCFAPVIDELLKRLGLNATLYGIEIDAYRRLSNFHSRYDYGVFYAGQCRQAEYHPVDFLKWKKGLDIAFLLNPFVSDEPTVQWGLPLSTLKPKDFFAHAHRLLVDQKGIAVLSTPSIEEFELALEFATKAGFKLGGPDEEIAWRPQGKSQQQKPRYGIILYSKLS